MCTGSKVATLAKYAPVVYRWSIDAMTVSVAKLSNETTRLHLSPGSKLSAAIDARISTRWTPARFTGRE